MKSQQLLEQLVRDKPLNVLWRKSWIESSRKLADALAQQNKLDEAINIGEAMLVFLDDMIAKDQAADWSNAQRESINAELANRKNPSPR